MFLIGLVNGEKENKQQKNRVQECISPVKMIRPHNQQNENKLGHQVPRQVGRPFISHVRIVLRNVQAVIQLQSRIDRREQDGQQEEILLHHKFVR